MTSECQGLLRMSEESIQAAKLLAGRELHRFAVSRAYLRQS